ncbi:hypothetical protein SAMN06295900_102280 [Trinickia caryophylli]|uniref:Uncharacterized protein n=1 Tax=Trinickia caryophylli TaxID=28094 RepID=A0A1X7D2U9_TRICW|nr:hypothetical protein SAMN06295900_102280 [Trinickia caryophylli]
MGEIISTGQACQFRRTERQLFPIIELSREINPGSKARTRRPSQSERESSVACNCPVENASERKSTHARTFADCVSRAG